MSSSCSMPLNTTGPRWHPVPAPTPGLPPLPGLSSLWPGSSGSLRVSPPPQGPDAVPASPFHTSGRIGSNCPEPPAEGRSVRDVRGGVSSAHREPAGTPRPPKDLPPPRDSLPGRPAAGAPQPAEGAEERRAEQARPQNCSPHPTASPAPGSQVGSLQKPCRGAARPWGLLRVGPSSKNCSYFLRGNWDSKARISFNANRLLAGWAQGGESEQLLFKWAERPCPGVFLKSFRGLLFTCMSWWSAVWGKKKRNSSLWLGIYGSRGAPLPVTDFRL